MKRFLVAYDNAYPDKSIIEINWYARTEADVIGIIKHHFRALYTCFDFCVNLDLETVTFKTSFNLNVEPVIEEYTYYLISILPWQEQNKE